MEKKLKFYTLLYLEKEERRILNRKEYSQQSRIDLFVRNACLLDKTLRLNGISLGGGVLTNDTSLVNESLQRADYKLPVKEIPFSLDVPKGIPFYSAHFKIDAFKFFATLPQNEYSILLDNDVIGMQSLPNEHSESITSMCPWVYHPPGNAHFPAAKRIDPSLERLDWAGGEFIGGNAEFFKKLHAEIMLVWEAYLRELPKGLSHIGDEMLTSIALQRLRDRELNVAEAGKKKIVYRYWGNEELQAPAQTDAMLVHLPYDKVFCANLNLSELRHISDFSKAFRKRIFRNFVVRQIKRILKQWNKTGKRSA